MPDPTTLLLAPMLILQGKWMRWRLPKLDEAAGPRQGRDGQGEPLSILVFGDSAAAGVGVTKQQQALVGQLASQLQQHYMVDWELLAQSGLKTAESHDLLANQAAKKVDVVVISLGVNDAKSTGSPQRWITELDAVVNKLRQKYQPSLLLVSELPPMGDFDKFPQPLRGWLGWRSTLFNHQLADWSSSQPDVQLTRIPKEGADLAVDGLHPGQNTYRLWANQASQQLQATLPSR